MHHLHTSRHIKYYYVATLYLHVQHVCNTLILEPITNAYEHCGFGEAAFHVGPTCIY